MSGFVPRGDGDQWVRLSDGSRCLIDPSDYVGRAAWCFGDLDPKISTIVRRGLRPGDLAVDVGANMGLVALRMCRRVGGGGHVVLFEPNPAMVARLRGSIEANGYGHAELHEVALGSEPGRLELAIPDGNAGMASLRPTDERSRRRVEVDVTTLDDVLLDRDRVRLMKIDVEGFETEVIKGASRLFESQPPDFVLYESNQVDRIEADPVHASLRAFGYRIFGIPRKLLTVALEPTAMKGPRSHHDFVAVRDGVDPPVPVHGRHRGR